MVYLLVVGLTMFVLPVGSIAVEASGGRADWLWLVGKWFVFWGVGVRLAMAGARQYLRPEFTSRDIMGIDAPEVFVLVRELGGANLAAGAVGIASLAAPSFVTPSALGAAIFYAVAAAEHVKAKHRNRNETIALVSDVFMAVVLAGFALGEWTHGLR